MGNHEVGLQKTSIPTENKHTFELPPQTHTRQSKGGAKEEEEEATSNKQRTRNRIITKSPTLEKTPEKDRSKLHQR
jgi:hypothetical protein